MPDLEPLPLADVLAIAERRRQRRQRLVVQGVLGAGAVAVVGAGVRLAGSGSPEAEPAATTATTPTTSPPTGPPAAPLPDAWRDDAVDAFVEAGLTFDDAARLGALWETDTYSAKVVVGSSPDPGAVAAASGAATYVDDAISSFLTSPYTFDDAVALAEAWDVELRGAKAVLGIEARERADPQG